MHILRRCTSPAACTLVAFGIVSCASVSGSAPRDTSDVAAIQQFYRELPRAIESADLSRFVALLDDSITVLIPGAAPIRGIPAYRSGLAQLFETATFRMSLNPPTLLEVASSLAFVSYTGELTTIARATAGSATARNRYVDILRKQSDGTWRLFLHSFQNDVSTDR